MQEHWSTIASNVVASLGILGFIGIYISHRQTEAQFKFNVMISCIERYQQLSPIIRNDADDNTRMREYVDLTNGEFFYFQRGYISAEVIVEWLDTIVEHFPLYSPESRELLNYDSLRFQIYP